MNPDTPPPKLRTLLGALSKTRLARTPTPLIDAPRLRRWLASIDGSGATPDILLKLDSETGFGLGGNKVRKLEYELDPEQLDPGGDHAVTHLITSGGPQSNHARVTAAAAARLGLGCTLVLNRGGNGTTDATGNARLYPILGADVRWVDDRSQREETVERVRTELLERGDRPRVVPLGASTPRGALGYVEAADELCRQMPPSGEGKNTWIFVASSSAGTLAGLSAGMTVLKRTDFRLVGISADVDADRLIESTRTLAAAAIRCLGRTDPVDSERLFADDGYVGDGYGIETSASRTALERFARSEGLLLDPVYTAKAAAGMIDWILSGRVPVTDRVVFLHTGGHPALFR